MSDNAHDRLSKLPTELLVLIFQQSTDFSSLWSLIHTSSYLSSVFDDYACMIGNAILNTKVPSPTRALMQAALSLHKGIFLCRTPEDQLYQFDWSEIQLLPSVSGTSSDIRWLIKLAHNVHVHSHMCIEVCMQRCLQSSLGDREYAEGFGIPTWTEEQRSLLGFWRLVVFNQLRQESRKGSLRWPPRAMNYLEHGRLFWDSSSPTQRMQITMARDYLPDYHSAPISQKPLVFSKILKLPPIPTGREFGWHCRPPPSWEAITQGQEPDKNFRATLAPDTALGVVTDLIAEQPSNKKRCQSNDAGGEPREELKGESSEEPIQEPIQEPGKETSPETSQGWSQRPDQIPDLKPQGARSFFRSSSDDELSSSTEPDDVYFRSDEHGEEDSDDDENEGHDDESSRSGSGFCILISASETESDSDDYEYPDRLRIQYRRTNEYQARPVQDFGSESTGEEECLNLERAPLGLQFWHSMVLNPEGGPGKYMRFDAYSQYGFLLWEEWRMIEFGLWSKKPIEDMSGYYQKWFRFLSPEDMGFHQKFRYVWDEDWL